MARPHVECVDIKDMPWTPANLPKSTGSARQRVLSMDWDTKAASLYIQLDPGWNRPKGYNHADTEYFVLEGELAIGEYRLYSGCYFRAPRYMAVGPFESSQGALLLYFREGPANFAVSQRNMGTVSEEAIFVDTNEMEWKPSMVPHDRTLVDKAEPLYTKVLYRSPITEFRHTDEDGNPINYYSRLVRAAPGWGDTRLSHHPVMEEGYILEGEMDYNFGKLTPGTYFWRPPRIKHGYFNTSDKGMVFLARDDGELVNLHTDRHGNPINYDSDSDLSPITAEPVRSVSFGEWDGSGM